MEPFRPTLDGSQVCSLFWGNSRQHMPVHAKMQRHIFLPVPSMVLLCLQPWLLMFLWCLSCRQVTGPEFLPQANIIFLLISLVQIGIRIPSSKLSLVSVINHLVGKCQPLTNIKSCEYVGLLGHSSAQY